MGMLITLILNSIAVFAAAYILPGVNVKSFMTALVVALVLGFINAVIRPFIFLLTLPINVLTLGLFTFVIIGGLVMLVSYLVPGFHVQNFWWALLFSFVMALFNSFITTMTRPYS